MTDILPPPPVLPRTAEDEYARRRREARAKARDRALLVDPAAIAKRALKHPNVRLEPATVEGIRRDARSIELARARQRRNTPVK